MCQCETIRGSSGKKLRELFDGPQGEELALPLVRCDVCSDWVLAAIDCSESPTALEKPSRADAFFRMNFCCG
jgi:hypothetical protein